MTAPESFEVGEDGAGKRLDAWIATAAGLSRGEAQSLIERGLVEGEGFTDKGEQLRASIEDATDRQERRVVEALGDDADELLDILEPWSKAVVASGGYPSDPSSLTRK